MMKKDSMFDSPYGILPVIERFKGGKMLDPLDNMLISIQYIDDEAHQLTAVDIDIINRLSLFQTTRWPIYIDMMVALRSSHPAIRKHAEVYFNPFKRSWIIAYEAYMLDLPLYLGGFPIHITPRATEYYRDTGSPLCPDRILIPGGYESMPAEIDCKIIHWRFPLSIGAEFMLGGYIRILMPSEKSIVRTLRNLRYTSCPGVIGTMAQRGGHLDNWNFIFVVAPQIEPQTPDVSQQVSLSSVNSFECKMPGGCIGAKIRLNGSLYLTTVTHGLVRRVDRPRGIHMSVFDRLRAFVTSQREKTVVEVCSAKTLISKKVYSASEPGSGRQNTLLGTVAKSYDRLRRPIMVWPDDFIHDLTLISYTPPPAGVSDAFQAPLRVSRLSKRFADPKQVWSDRSMHDCFVAFHDVLWGHAYTLKGKIQGPMEESSIQALISGVSYRWSARGNDIEDLKRAMLWRTTGEHFNPVTRKITRGDAIDAIGASGALLCIGRADSHVPAMPFVFQNFQEQLFDAKHDMPSTTCSIKGGFFLPEEVQRSTLVLADEDATPWSDPVRKTRHIRHYSDQRPTTSSMRLKNYDL